MDMSKPKIGIIAIAKVNHQKDEIRDMVAYLEKRIAQEAHMDAMICRDVLFDEYQIQQEAHRMEVEGADALLLIVGTWVFSSHAISAVNDLCIPFILFGQSDEIANGNFGASIQIHYVLQEMKKKFLYLYGSAKDEENVRKILQYTNAAHVVKAIRNKKIATIGGKCMMMYQTQVNEFSWKRTFGIDFPQYDTVQVFTEMKYISDEDADNVAEEFKKRFDRIVWKYEETGEYIGSDVFRSQAKMYLAFKRLQEMYGIEVFANKCMPEMASEIYGYKYAGCIATCLLNEAGILTACEADLPAALSMLLLSRLSNQKVFFADIAKISQDKRRLTFFNCGTAPVSLADRNQPVEIWPNPDATADEGVVEEYMKHGADKKRGGCVRFDLENDREVTILRVGGNEETLRFHVARAKTCPREVRPNEALGQRWPGFGLEFEGKIDEFIQKTVGHHYTLCLGNWTEELRYMASIYDIGFEFYDGLRH
jgi:L-fucose isomerase-like protein